MGQPTNDKRFFLSDWYDKSTYLSNQPRKKGLIPFRTQPNRDKDLIAKRGENGAELGGKSDVYYGGHEERCMRATKRRFDTGIPKIEKVTNRKGAFGSMYRQEPDFTPDFYDSVKIADATIKTK